MRLLRKLDKDDERVKALIDEVIYEPFGERSIGKLDVWSFDVEKWDKVREKMGDLINEYYK